ncbi:hypothetical protein ACQY0O_000336 [Thecaphora frezii]
MAPASAVSVRGFFGSHRSSRTTFGRGTQARPKDHNQQASTTASSFRDAEGAAFRQQRVHSFVRAGRARLNDVLQQPQLPPLCEPNVELPPAPQPAAPELASSVSVHSTQPPQGRALTRTPTLRSRRASTATARTEFSVSSAINKGYSARIEIEGKVKPLPSVPKRTACQTIAFLEGPGSQDKIYRPGQDVCGQVHLARCDPERGVITGIKARIRGDLETSVFGVGDSSFYSGDSKNGIAKRQILFYNEQATLCQKADLDSGQFDLHSSGLVDHHRKNNLAVPFKFTLPLKVPATALDLLDNKLKASYKRGKKFVDLPPSICMETRYEPPKATQMLNKARERYSRQRLLRPMAHIKYEIDIIVTRQRMGSYLLPPKRGERLILSFQVEPYPPMTAALPVPNMAPIRLQRMRSNASELSRRSGADSTVSAENEEEEEEDSWTRDLGGYREPAEVFGALPREITPVRTRSRTSVTRLPSHTGQPKVKKSSTVKLSPGMDGRLTGWLTHEVETEVSNVGNVEAILSVPATAAFYMETKVPFSVELRMPSRSGRGVEPIVEMKLARSVLTFSRLGTLTVEAESPDSLDGFSGPESWSERIRILDLKRTPEDQLPPFYERDRTRQMFSGNFVINRYERVLKPNVADALEGGSSRKGGPVAVPELCLVTPSFSFRALRLEYRLHVRIALSGAQSEAPASLTLVTPPVTVAGSISSEPQIDEFPELEAPTPRPEPLPEPGRDSFNQYDPDATPLARTPARRSLDPGYSRFSSEAPAYSATDPAELETPSGGLDFGFPSLEPVPDEMHEDENLNEQMALGLITLERLAAVVEERQPILDLTVASRPEMLLPSYGESSGIFDI